MKYWKIWSVFIIALSIVACSDDESPEEEQTDDFNREAMLVSWADTIIIPSYASFKANTESLETETNTFTSAPSIQGLQNLREKWVATYIAFQSVSMFEIGKAEELNYRNRLNAYPTNTSEIDGFIVNGNYDLTLPSTIDAQGFPALDYMINGLAETDDEIVAFYTTNPNKEGYKMYLSKLAETIDSLTNDVLTNWTSTFRDTFVANTSSSATGSVDKFTNDYIFFYEKALRAGKVGIPAGIFSNNPLPQNVEGFYKKDISKQLLIASINATKDFFNGKAFNGTSNGPSFKLYLDFLNTIKNGEDLSVLINSQFDLAIAKANELNPNFINQINSDNSKMLSTYDELQRNVILLKVDMLQALNINIDFVDADGD